MATTKSPGVDRIRPIIWHGCWKAPQKIETVRVVRSREPWAAWASPLFIPIFPISDDPGYPCQPPSEQSGSKETQGSQGLVMYTFPTVIDPFH